MELSMFERTVLGKLIEGDSGESILRQQLVVSRVRERNYSGKGLFVHLEMPEGTPLITVVPERVVQERPTFMLAHPDLEHGGGAIVFLREGRMDMLECYTFTEAWPENEALFRVEAAKWHMDPTH